MTKHKQTKLCNTCVRNINSKHIKSINGECQFCIDFDKHKNNLFKNIDKVQGDFLTKLKKQKGKGDYDCLIMLSGGKDSTMTLYKISKESNLRCLAYTFDNGFESEEAIENIHNAVEKLEIDWIFDKPGNVKKIFRTILTNKIEISLCRFCVPLMINRAVKLAINLKIPSIVTGWNKGQSDKEPSRHPLWKIDKQILDSLLKKYPYMQKIGLQDYENEGLIEKSKIQIISPWIGEKRETNKYIQILKNKLNWQIPKYSYPNDSTNCVLNFLQVILSRKYFSYTHYDCEESMLINYGEINKDEAIKTLDQDIDINLIHKILKKLELTLEDIGLNKEEIEQFSKFRN